MTVDIFDGNGVFVRHHVEEKESAMGDYIRYVHHGQRVWVRKDLLGRHRDFCLCHSCAKFMPNQDDNCVLAQTNYEFCVRTGLVTPVWECPVFEKVADEVIYEGEINGRKWQLHCEEASDE